MISLWWSFALTAIGVTGLFFVYRSNSRVGPIIGLAVQGLWIAYAIATQQWWFLVSAFAYGSANVYGLRKRKNESSQSNEVCDQVRQVFSKATRHLGERQDRPSSRS